MNQSILKQSLDALNFTDFVQKTCKPLFKNIGNNHFSYVEMNRNGEYFWLGSSNEYFEKCKHQQLVDNAPLSILKTYPKPGFYLIDVYSDEYRQHSETVFTLLNQFDLGHSFRMLEVSTHNQEPIIKLYSYDALLAKKDINHVYINSIDTLKKFNRYFDNELSSMRNDLHKSKMDETSQSEFFELIKSLNGFCHPTNNSFDAEFISSKLNNAIKLTKREREILSWYMRGKTAKQTADILSLSNRTIERHFENLREKFGCDSKSQIAMHLLNGF